MLLLIDVKKNIFWFFLILQLHYNRRQCEYYDNSRVGLQEFYPALLK